MEANNGILDQPSKVISDPSEKQNEDEYFEVLTYEQDDIVHISKKDIIKYQPAVKLLRLTPSEITKTE